MQPNSAGAAAPVIQKQVPDAIPLWDGGASMGTHVLTRLSVSCLSYLSVHSGSSGAQVARGLGVRHLSQASRLLSRLEAQGLVVNDPTNRENAWALTRFGRELLDEAQPVWAERAGLQAAPTFTPTVSSIPA